MNHQDPFPGTEQTWGFNASALSKILIAKDAAEKALTIEMGRAEALVGQAWRFTAATMIVLGFQLREIKGLVESPWPLVKVLCGLSLVALGAALFLAINGMQRTGWVQYPRGNKLWDNLKPENVSAEAANEALVQTVLQAREQTARLNDAQSRTLNLCSWLFLAGLLLAAVTLVIEAFADWT